jgi:hypothetical protein
MLNFARFLDRVRPQTSLAIALTFSVVWIAALDYGLLRLVCSVPVSPSLRRMSAL